MASSIFFSLVWCVYVCVCVCLFVCELKTGQNQEEKRFYIWSVTTVRISSYRFRALIFFFFLYKEIIFCNTTRVYNKLYFNNELYKFCW